MDATEFVKKHGVAKAVIILENKDAQESELYWVGFGYLSDLAIVGSCDCQVINASCVRDGLVTAITLNPYFSTIDSFLEFDDVVNLEALKQIVEAWELVGSKGNLRLAHNFMQSEKFKSYSREDRDNFENAINLVEQCLND